KAAPAVLPRFAAHKLPDESIETAELFLHVEKLLRIVHCRFHLQPVAYDTLILQQRFYFIRIISGNSLGVEIVESGAKIFAFAQNGNPAQSRLRTFQQEELEECAVIMLRHAPFLVMVSA